MVKRIFYILLFLLIIILVQSCLISATGMFDDKLSIEKRTYKGEELRIDGYYYNNYYNNYYNMIFIYCDGILLYGGATKYSELSKKEERITTESWIKETKRYKYDWGLFNIDNNIIKFERWYPSSGGPLKAYVRKGIILNDTTFVIKESYRMVNGKKKRFR